MRLFRPVALMAMILGVFEQCSMASAQDALFDITSLDVSKLEGDGAPTTFTFSVENCVETSQTFTLDYAVSGTDVDGADFAGGVLPSGTLNFGSLEGTKTFTVSVSADTDIEPDETFTVTIFNPSEGAEIGVSTATAIILNDDGPTTLAIDNFFLAQEQSEGNSGTVSFFFDVNRRGDLSGTTSVNFSVSGGLASPDDFGGTFPSGIVNFSIGELTQQITVDVTGDTLVEADETFVVTLDTPTNGATITTATASATIADDDGPPKLTIAASGSPKLEGDTGFTSFTFIVTRTGNLSTSVFVDYDVSGSTGLDAADFDGGSLPSGTVNLACPGQASAPITIRVRGDTIPESDETFTVTLSNPTGGAVIMIATATGTILDDDRAFAITAVDSSLAEGDSGTTTFSFTVTRSGNISGTASVDYAVTGSSGLDGTDFGGSLPSGTLDFVGGVGSMTIMIDVSGDTDIETDEIFTVTLSNPSGATISTATASATIVDDDTPASGTFTALEPVLTIAAVDSPQPEGDSGNTAFTFVVTRTGDTSGTSSVEYAVTGGGGLDGADFGGSLPSGIVNFGGWVESQLITIQVTGDTDIETDETFTVMLSNPTDATIGTAAASATITDDDTSQQPTLAIASVDSPKTEGDTGTIIFTFTVTRSGDTTGASSVDYGVTGSSGLEGEDFDGATLPSGTVDFATGESIQTITIAVAGDATPETDETFTVTLSNPNGATISTGTAMATIVDDDVPCTRRLDCINRGDGFACDTGTCVPCLSNFDCRSNTDNEKRICLTCEKMGMPTGCTSSNHKCVDCDSNRACRNAGRGRACEDNTCIGCSSNWQCRNFEGDGEGDFCVANECVECTINRHCKGSVVGRNCVDNKCIECTRNWQCRRKNTMEFACQDSTCVGCTSDFQCQNYGVGVTSCVGNVCI